MQEPMAEDAAPELPTAIVVGSLVTVTDGYNSYGDASDGPLSPGIFGTVIQTDSSDKPYKVTRVII